MAQKVGVSEATVSRVLNGKPGAPDATRTTALTALDVLGYERPTQLRGDRARLVGLVLPELGNPIFPAFAEVLAGGIAARGLTPVLCVGDAPHDHFARLAQRRVPVVLVNASVEHLGLPTVSTDDRAAVELTVAHLRSLGHVRIGLVLGPPDHVPSRRKLAAFAALGGDETAVEHTYFTLEGGQAATTLLLARGVTAVVCASDPLALGAVRAVRRAGRHVPGDVSVVGFDDSPLMACTDPALTTVRQPIEAMGRAALTLLAGQIEGTFTAPSEMLFEPELVVRASTGAVPAP